jgi:hypothetical protein
LRSKRKTVACTNSAWGFEGCGEGCVEGCFQKVGSTWEVKLMELCRMYRRSYLNAGAARAVADG